MHSIIREGAFDTGPYSEAAAIELYRDMVRTRRFDDRALALQRRGWMSGYPPFRGQEAAQVGAAHAMSMDDWLFPTYRSNALQIARGVPMSDILAFRRGRPEYTSEHEIPVFPQAVPIATQIPHATGAAMARNYRDNEEAMLVCFGDGATSEGDFHEGLNFAGVFDAPVVFFCENNGWAISHPTARQTAATSIAAKADAYGIDAVQVDGNDPLAVRATVESAIADAKSGTPVLVEALTYRQGAHTTADDPSRYRDDAPDLPAWRTRDPLDRYREYLLEAGVLSTATIDEINEEADAELSAAVQTVESLSEPDPSELFTHAYAIPTMAVDRSERAFRTDHGG